MSDVTDMKAEVLLLRRENAEMRDEIKHLLIKRQYTEDVYTKLRKLIRKAWKWSKNGCHECPMETNCKVQLAYEGDCGMALEIEGDMRELGIEVGE